MSGRAASRRTERDGGGGDGGTIAPGSIGVLPSESGRGALKTRAGAASAGPPLYFVTTVRAGTGALAVPRRINRIEATEANRVISLLLVRNPFQRGKVGRATGRSGQFGAVAAPAAGGEFAGSHGCSGRPAQPHFVAAR